MSCYCDIQCLLSQNGHGSAVAKRLMMRDTRQVRIVPVSAALTGISSMATRQVLSDLAALFKEASGRNVTIESVGGVDAAKRVRAGETFDLVLLAEDALEKLEAEGHVLSGSRTGFVRSALAVAYKTGTPAPDFTNVESVRAALLAAKGIGYSTGPSGTYLVNLIKSWGLESAIGDKLKQAPPGVPVGSMVVNGDVELGFQQLSELITMPGLEIIDPLPPGVAYVTTFSGAVGAHARDPEGAQAFLSFLASPQTVECKRANGMAPA